MTVTVSIGSAIGEVAPCRTAVTIPRWVVDEIAFAQRTFLVIRPAVGNDAVYLPLFQPLADAGGEVSRIKANGFYGQAKALALSV